ncbi:MAG: DUF58 domain-containing protein [Clostridiaceae bacterium]|nr:DUF58 domain-containing protein [Clostridiaceae bacterium]
MIKPRFIFWLLALFIGFLFNNLVQHKIMLILMLLLLIMPIFSLLYSFYTKRKISVEISTQQDYIVRGENALWDFEIINHSLIQAIFIQVKIKFPKIINQDRQLKSEILIPQKSSQTLRIVADSAYSGPFNFSNLAIYANDIFGFFRIKLFSEKDLDSPNIIVLPKEEQATDYKQYLSNQLEAGEFPAGKSHVLLDEISRFRSMEAGDSLKLIHWKLSARMQEWMVKEFDKEDDRTVTVLLNLPEVNLASDKDQSKLLRKRNFMLDHSYTAMQIFLSNRATVRLKTYQPELVVEEVSTMNEIDLLQKQLAFIPFERIIDFQEQLADERFDNEQNLIYLLTYKLNDSLIADLRNIRPHIGAMLLVYVIDEDVDETLIQSQIEKLSTNGINVEIAKTHEANVYE